MNACGPRKRSIVAMNNYTRTPDRKLRTWLDGHHHQSIRLDAAEEFYAVIGPAGASAACSGDLPLGRSPKSPPCS